ncbi:MAG: FHA domain-containing protein [Gammaproteobacteria bacterium]
MASGRATEGRGAAFGAALSRVLLVLGLLAQVSVRAASTLTEQLDIACAQPSALELRCDYRLLDEGDLRAVAAEWQDHVVPGTLGARYPRGKDTTALLVLVDTSDPARAPAVAAAVRHIDALLDAAPAHLRVGIASFDTEFTLLAPPGADAATLRAATATLAARGRTTELYRNARDAVRVLARTPATRRALLILSDGLAEDYAYHHADVVELARAEGVVIDAIGYPRSVPQSVALQTLRRLADDTGGHYLQANHPDFHLPERALERTLALLDSGGALSFDLAPLAAAGAQGAIEVSLAFQTRDQSFLVLAPVRLPGGVPAAPAVSPPPATAPAPTGTAPAAAAAPAIDLDAGRAWPWLTMLGGLLLAILVGVAVVYLRVRGGVAPPPPPGKPLAWLVLAEAPWTRHAILRTPWRIGRGRNNDLTLSDHSVSRLHAEIRANESGALTLHDLESLNGVFVNDTRIEAVQLREGDAVDVGDVGLRFTLRDESDAAQEATVMVRTRTPA